MRPVIHTKKHLFQISQSTVAQAIAVNVNFINTIEGASSAPDLIEEGALVKACYIELWLSQDSASTVGSYTVIVYKDPGGTNPALTADMAALHDYNNKKNILFTGQGLLTPNDGGQVPAMRGWYKIPKGKQRFGLGDRMRITLRNNNLTAIDINFCGIVIFKEQT